MKFKLDRDAEKTEDWADRVLWLWQEDECLRSDPSAEGLTDAVTRMAGSMYDCNERFQGECEHEGIKRGESRSIEQILGPSLAEKDFEDATMTLYRRGWVVQVSFDGESLGRVVKVG